jgi:metal-responsive CopG/Arc/MetJ family transcriptional regulator
MKRGLVQNKEALFIGAWLPKPLARQLDLGVAHNDSDRSKFIRAAVREKLERHGINHPDPVEASR